MEISDKLKQDLKIFLDDHGQADLVSTYLFFLEKKHRLHPVIFIREKTIYSTPGEITDRLGAEGKLWRETEIKIQFNQPSVNEETKRIYICPFTGKVFGNNTHPNPQDAIYDWVSKCPENTERHDGLKVKRFFISEDPEVIKNYIQKGKDPITKKVFSSAVSGKLFNSKQGVIDDFVQNQLKALPLSEVPSQNRFNIDEKLLAFLQENLEETKINAFVESLGNFAEFKEHVELWLEEA
ncbi:MAG: DUF2709 domain-containing protein [Chlamydiia bacterium]|nr:DUF2709 domain-containing protein [Chlamydiia bacterium]MCP5509361.1 DUF2709 domain-containing protein [Chlamydiales bacterium]